uniref:Putative ovule protein n=1 Tax=Solanum chacoense TaxID=4108 RepID=A0A0V0GSC8_SOLCH
MENNQRPLAKDRREHDYKVGDGRKTKFSGDAWNNQNPLKDIFLNLIIICNNPESIVKECSTDHRCDFSFRRLLNIK